jgi:DNA modification methylase
VSIKIESDKESVEIAKKKLEEMLLRKPYAERWEPVSKSAF